MPETIIMTCNNVLCTDAVFSSVFITTLRTVGGLCSPNLQIISEKDLLLVAFFHFPPKNKKKQTPEQFQEQQVNQPYSKAVT